MRHKLVAVFALSCAPAAALAQRTVLRFDDLPRNVHAGEGYAALGVHFSLTDWAVMGGRGEADPGNWGLRGTNGSAFMGFNSISGYSMTITFDSLVEEVSFDAARANGSMAGNRLDVTYWNGPNQVAFNSITFGNINVWSTFAYEGRVDRVTLEGRGTGPIQAYGVDNMSFIPQPAPFATLLMAGSVFASRRRRAAHR